MYKVKSVVQFITGNRNLAKIRVAKDREPVKVFITKFKSSVSINDIVNAVSEELMVDPSQVSVPEHFELSFR